MQSSTATKRLGVSLNVDTGYRKEQSDIALPETPTDPMSNQNQRKITPAMLALKQRPGPRETFLDDSTPIDPANREVDRVKHADHRDSHDLSLSPREVTRDSLVNQMLLSLDQFSLFTDGDGFGGSRFDDNRIYSSFGEEEPYPAASSLPPTRTTRGHSYSYSSDYENADDSSRYSSGQASRGRRSNSSSNFQTNLGRINSVRNGQAPQRPIHSRSGKGSKASSAGSVDLGHAQVTGTQRWAHGLPGRSSSFDYGMERPALGSRTATMVQSANPLPSPMSPYDYDAAPTPTVPGGPRKARPSSPVVLPHIDQARGQSPAPAPAKLERKRSTRSSKSAYKGKTLLTSASVSRFEYNMPDKNTELPPMPAFMKDSAPSPSVSYSKSPKELPSPTPQKEKQGFFRRVFGSSKSHTPAQESPSPVASSPASTSADRPGTRQYRAASQPRNPAVPPSREAPTPPKDVPHTLTKKPSSFFRRRKKSMSEPEPPLPRPPVPPLNLPPDKDLSNIIAINSPSTSLRQVMHPYLASSVKSPAEPKSPSKFDRQTGDGAEDRERYTRGFSPDYEPDQSATIRTVEHPSQVATENLDSTNESKLKSTSSLRPNMGPSHEERATSDRDITFLQDSSDNDREGHTPKSQSAATARDKRSPDPSWTSPSSTTTTRAKGPAVTPKDTLGSKIGETKANASANDDDWVILSPRSPLSSKPANTNTSKSPKDKADRKMWLDPSSSEESLTEKPKLTLPGEVASTNGRTSRSGSTDTAYKSATSLPIVQIEGQEHNDSSSQTKHEQATSTDQAPDPSVPTQDDRDRALMIYNGDEDFIQKEKAAAWMGDADAVKARTLVAYMELYNFANMSILTGMRNLCGRLILRAESQQVDRILDAFAQRWCQCNPNHGFKVPGKSHLPLFKRKLLTMG